MKLRHAFVNVGAAVADLSAVVAAFVISYRAYIWTIDHGLRPYTTHPALSQYVAIGGFFGVMVLLVFWWLGMYRRRASILNLWEVRTAIKGLLLTAAFLFAALFFFKLEFSRVAVFGGIGLAAIFVVLERRVLSELIGELQLTGKLGKRILIHGCGQTGKLVMKKIVHAPHLGCTVVGFLDDREPRGSRITCRLSQTGPVFIAPVLGSLDELCSVAKTHRADELLVTTPSTTTERLREIFQRATDCGIGVAMVPHMGDIRVDQLVVEDLSAIPILRPLATGPRRANRVAKRAVDLVAGAALGLVTLPLWMAAVAMIRLEGSGTILFKQERVGSKGTKFPMFKFRTMHPDTDPYAVSPDGDTDPRITKVGRFLRATGLDELPQILNVLRGEMSLVGPRPEMPFIAERYGPVERLRLEAKPGVTGLWQISADRHAQIHENIEYDLYYLNHQSLLLDALILLETAFFTVGLGLKCLRRLANTARYEPQLAYQSPMLLGSPDPLSAEDAGIDVLLVEGDRVQGRVHPRFDHEIMDESRRLLPSAVPLEDMAS